MEDLTPASVEFSGDGGLTLRGIRWGEAPARCLLLHDIGGDLDMWDVIPAALAAAGMSALAIDLPGHGLSDEGPELPVGEILRRCGDQITAMPMVLGMGDSADAILHDAAELRLAGMVGLGPAWRDGDSPARSPFVPKLLIGRTGIEGEVAACRRLTNACGGWAIASSLPTDAPFPDVIASPLGPMVTDAVVAFCRDCLARVPRG